MTRSIAISSVLYAVVLCVALVFGASPLSAADDARGSVELRITGFPSSDGVALIELFDSATGYEQVQPSSSVSRPIVGDVCEWRIDDLPPGEYSLRVVHDENINGRLDFTSFGPPAEAVAFSNNARAAFRAPDFAEVRFQIEADGVTQQSIAFPRRGRWAVGVGAVTGTQPYVGIPNRFIGFPQIGYEGDRVSWRGPRLTIRTTTIAQVDVSLLASVRFDGFDSSDSSRLEGLDDRDKSVDGGIHLQRSFLENWRAEVEFIRDLLNVHGGQEFRAEVRRTFAFDRFSVAPFGGISILSNRTADYYYGVRRREAQPGRPAHNVGSAVNWRGGLAFSYRSPRSWIGIMSITADVLDRDIKRSPIVERDVIVGAYVGISYVF